VRQLELRVHIDDLVVDNFAGGGGASTGIELALGRSPDIAVNHDPEAIAMHAVNHPRTRHFCESIWDIDPRMVCGRRKVGLAWFSPDCTFHSKARGAKPFRDRNRARRRRGLAWVVVRWAEAVRPRVIMLENVEEFEHWGPLGEDGLPCPERRGGTFQRWVARLRNLGYVVEWRQLRACDFGAPTTRNRLFVIARCDGESTAWPEPTHGSGRLPYRTAAECIDWSIPCPSIFDRERPLADKTLARIARGLRRYVIDAAEPFIVPGPIAPTLVQTGYGERPGQVPRALDLHQPLGTVVAGGAKHALVSAFLAKHYGGHEGSGSSLAAPIDTVTARDHHSLVRAFLLKYYGAEQDPRLTDPLHTITTRHRFGLVAVRGERYVIADIGMRMLAPRELFRAQGFADSYQIDVGPHGEALTKTAQVRMCGNSVCPPLARALVTANFSVRQARRREAA
jgi:DNA (cytosine-5)-methyltransferase 1